MNWILVACGGAIGACSRYALGMYIAKPTDIFPWPTWWINLIGCLLAGMFFALSVRFPVLQQEARLLLMVGILGGFTTFSSFGLETFLLLKHGQVMIAMTYALSSVLLGVICLGVGFYLIQSLLQYVLQLR